MRKGKRIMISILAGLTGLLSLAGCKGKYADLKAEESGTMLFDYFREATGLPGGNTHYEIVLNSFSEKETELRVYELSFGAEEETEAVYRVPAEALDGVMDIVKKKGLEKWKEDTGCPITGGRYVVKFRENGDYRKITSDMMPEDGMAAFNEIEATLAAYVKEEYRVRE